MCYRTIPKTIVACTVSLLLCGVLIGCANVSTTANLNKPAYPTPFFVEIVKAVKPSIVNISTNKIKNQNVSQDKMLNSPLTSLGSGFIITENGIIVTTNHVISNAETIIVCISANEIYKANIIATDKEKDIAIIKIEPQKPLPFIKLGSSSTLEVGEWVIAIGNPFGLEKTVTAGIISAKGRVIGSGKYDELLQTDAAINPGNSGGPLLNMKGEVIGINTAIIGSSTSHSGIGFAIPIDTVRSIIEHL